jgi:hypothetical protein
MRSGDAPGDDSGSRKEIERASVEPESLNIRRDLRDLRRDAYENFRILVAVTLESVFYVLWVGIMIAIHIVLRLIGPLDFPFNIIPDAAELIAQFGVLCVIAIHTFRFVIRLKEHKRAKKSERAQELLEREE